MGEKGLLYVATGQKYVEEAIVSYETFKKVHPDLLSVIYTDEANYDRATQFFSQVEIIENPSYNFCDKIRPMSNSPFEKTIFVDSDTYLNESLDDVWELLDFYDFGLVHSLGRIDDHLPDVPQWFCEMNTGVIFYRNSAEALNVLSKWDKTYQDLFEKKDIYYDQASFRKTLWEEKPNYFVLPTEYNFCTFMPNVTTRNYPVKIFHGRYKDFSKAVKYFSKNPEVSKVYVQDFRFLTHKNLVSFNFIQSDNWIYRCLIKGFSVFYKVLSRLFTWFNVVEHKKKGN